MPDNIPVLSTFGKNGTEVCVINYRNEDGALDFPDIERIKSEKEMDY